MMIKTIAIKQTKQLKPYCPLTIELIADVHPGDNVEDCVLLLKEKANEWLEKEAEEITVVDTTPYHIF